MSDSVIDDVNEGVIKELTEQLNKLRDENMGLKSSILRCHEQQKARIEDYNNMLAKFQKASMERDSTEEDLTRFKNLIDFLQRYVLDEI